MTQALSFNTEQKRIVRCVLAVQFAFALGLTAWAHGGIGTSPGPLPQLRLWVFVACLLLMGLSSVSMLAALAVAYLHELRARACRTIAP